MTTRRWTRRAAVLMVVAVGAATVAACGDDGKPATTSAAVSTTAAPASTGPASTPPASSGPGSTAPATTEPGSSGRETTEPATTGPATTEPATTGPAVTEPAGTTSTVPVATMQLNAYFVRGEDVALVHRSVPVTVATSAAAMGQLLGGPSAAEAAIGLSSAIPTGTELRGVSITAGVATVDLTGTYGTGGGSLSMMLRLAQVVYTLTQFPSVQAVMFEVDGQPVGTFGSEGIVIDHALGRADFEEQTPPIFVDGPAPFDVVGPQLRVFGTSNVFEATFVVRLTGPDGKVLYEHSQMASSGTGTRGTFDFTIDVGATTHGAGLLRLWEPSAKDGSDTNVIEIPVQM